MNPASEKINSQPWKLSKRPGKILAIRLQAMGDVVITLPYLRSLKNQLPETQVDFLTRREVDEIPRSIELFNSVFSIKGGRNFKRQFLSGILMLPRLFARLRPRNT